MFYGLWGQVGSFKEFLQTLNRKNASRAIMIFTYPILKSPLTLQPYSLSRPDFTLRIQNSYYRNQPSNPSRSHTRSQCLFRFPTRRGEKQKKKEAGETEKKGGGGGIKIPLGLQRRGYRFSRPRFLFLLVQSGWMGIGTRYGVGIEVGIGLKSGRNRECCGNVTGELEMG